MKHHYCYAPAEHIKWQKANMLIGLPPCSSIRTTDMDISKDGRFPLTVSLDAECHAFVERFIRVGFFASRDEMIAAALDALARDIEASARNAAMDEGLPDAEDASLEELADMLGQSDRRRES